MWLCSCTVFRTSCIFFYSNKITKLVLCKKTNTTQCSDRSCAAVAHLLRAPVGLYTHTHTHTRTHTQEREREREREQKSVWENDISRANRRPRCLFKCEGVPRFIFQEIMCMCTILYKYTCQRDLVGPRAMIFLAASASSSSESNQVPHLLSASLCTAPLSIGNRPSPHTTTTLL